MKFKGTDIEFEELTNWIKVKYQRYKVTEIRYFGSRVFGNPREDSDIDVYILFDGKAPNKPPVYTEIYKKYQIEFHPFIDFHDGYVPTWLLQNNAKNQI